MPHVRQGRVNDVQVAPLDLGDVRLLYLAGFVAKADIFATAPLLVTISRDLGYSLRAVTAMATFYYLLYGLMQPVYGILSDRVGRARVLRYSLLAMGGANLVSALAPNLAVLLIGRAMAGGFTAAVFPATLVYVGDKILFGQRQHVVANLLAAGAIGTVLSTLGAGLLAGFATWRLVFVILAVLALVLAVMLGRLPESLSRHLAAGLVTHVRRVFTHPWALFLFVVALAECAATAGFFTFMAPALEGHGETAAVAGLVVSTQGVAVFVGLQILKRHMRRSRTSPAALIVIGGGALVAAYAIAAVGQGRANILLASVVFGLGFANLHSTLQTWATDVVPEARGTAMAFFVTGLFVGAAISTAAVSGLADAGRYRLLFLVAAGVALAVVVVSPLAQHRYQAARGTLGAPVPAGEVNRTSG